MQQSNHLNLTKYVIQKYRSQERKDRTLHSSHTEQSALTKMPSSECQESLVCEENLQEQMKTLTQLALPWQDSPQPYQLNNSKTLDPSPVQTPSELPGLLSEDSALKALLRPALAMPGTTNFMRCILVDWIFEVAAE